jgi:hypothetical protein
MRVSQTMFLKAWPAETGVTMTATELMDAAVVEECKVAALRIVGWQLLLFDTIPVVFIWAGLSVGSDLWLCWSMVEALFGIGLLRVAARRSEEATRQYERAAKMAAAEVAAKRKEAELRAA